MCSPESSFLNCTRLLHLLLNSRLKLYYINSHYNLLPQMIHFPPEVARLTTPKQIFHLQSSRLVTVAMDGGLLSSPVHPIGMSAHPGSLKTAFSITAYNEGGFISALSKCQSGINANVQTHMHRDRACGPSLFCMDGIFGNRTLPYFPACT